MKHNLAPTLVRSIGELNILWFQKSNGYVVLNHLLFELLSHYLKSNDFDEFYSLVVSGHSIPPASIASIYKELSLLLQQQQQSSNLPEDPIEMVIEDHLSDCSCKYLINGKKIVINYKSEKIKSIFHPQYNHLSASFKVNDSTEIIDIDHRDRRLFLYRNKYLIGHFAQSMYHKLNGKLGMLLLCLLTDKSEMDWIGTFHASTICNQNEALMLIGTSGSGKSTLSILACVNGYKLVADDISPLSASDLAVHQFPSAISLKQGGLKAIQSLYNINADSPRSNLSKTKGPIQYVAPSNTYNSSHYRCNKVILVDYQETVNTKFDRINLSEVLSILVPDSWISPHQENVTRFLDWLETLQCYKLTYSNNDDALAYINQIFHK